MFSFIAAVWNRADSGQATAAEHLQRVLRQSSAGFTCVLSSPGFAAFVSRSQDSGCTSYLLPRNSGVVLGTLFRHTSDPVSASADLVLHPAEAEQIIQSEGRSLTQLCWGRYVAFITNADGKQRHVLRSPTGELDCLRTKFRGVDLFFSEMAACEAAGVSDFAINWDFLAASAYDNIGESRATGLQGVERVIHGECIRIDHSHQLTRAFYWTPFGFAKRGDLRQPEEAASQLHAWTTTCTRAWASRYQSVLLLLSGGFDSSVLLSCLAHAPARPRVTCVNLRNRYDASSEERYFARLAAERAQCELLEFEHTLDYSLRDRLCMPRLEAPATNIYSFAPDTDIARATGQVGATAYISGDGGDQLLYRNLAALTCGDYLLSRGPSRQFWGLVWNAAHIEHMSIWSVLFREMFRSPIDHYKRSPYGSLVSAEVRESQRGRNAFLHPWFEEAQRLPLGKLWHLLSVTFAMGNTLSNPVCSRPDVELIFPLVSQPLIELAMRIPSFTLLSGGRDRGLARQAFRHDVPREIIQRYHKAVVADMSVELLKRNIDVVKERLLDGWLVKNKILDRSILEQVFTGSVSKVSVDAMRILEYVTFEAWISAWKSPAKRAAA